MNEPVASRPHIPGYGIPESLEGLLSWSDVEKNLQAASSYWLVTVAVDGSPHSRPVDGIWLDGLLYFAGCETKWSSNLRGNSRAEVHLENTQQVVILKGRVEWVSASAPGMERVIEAGKKKYRDEYRGDRWAFRPNVAFAWRDFPVDATRWRFS
jgi:Pyridoxamine 5'-phosphate oxidase